MPFSNFPFTAVAGQHTFKLALILAAINPACGGVLVSGPRGSAKSTLARGLADILIDSTDNHASPFVTLPLGASEDMLVGTLNLEQVLNDKKVAFQEGLLAKAHGGVLYVDEVNLLADHLVDLLLDVAVSGLNIVERDGVSHSHAAQFVLLGTMNPDEGELRPQLQDRFGFSVELNNQYSIDERIAIVRLREEFDRNPEVFIDRYQSQQNEIKQSIQLAHHSLDKVMCADKWRVLIAERCQQANVDGVRADIVWYRAAVAHAAWRLCQPAHRDSLKSEVDSIEVTEEDVLAVEELVLAHRRHTPSDPTQTNPPSNNTGHGFSRPSDSRSSDSVSSDSRTSESAHSTQEKAQGDWGSMSPQQQLTAENDVPITMPVSPRQAREKISGHSYSKPQRSQYSPNHHAAVLSEKGRRGNLTRRAINWCETLIANAGCWPLETLRFRKAPMGQPVLHLMLLDTSASTLQQGLLASAKAAILSIAKQAYTRRETISIIGFGNDQVKTLLPQQKAPKVLRQYLDSIKAAGGTPLRKVLRQALQQQQFYYRRMPDVAIQTYLITDGRTTQSFDDLQLLGDVMVIDTEQAAVKRGKAKQIADALGASYFALPPFSMANA